MCTGRLPACTHTRRRAAYDRSCVSTMPSIQTLPHKFPQTLGERTPKLTEYHPIRRQSRQMSSAPPTSGSRGWSGFWASLEPQGSATQPVDVLCEKIMTIFAHVRRPDACMHTCTSSCCICPLVCFNDALDPNAAT